MNAANPGPPRLSVSAAPREKEASDDACDSAVRLMLQGEGVRCSLPSRLHLSAQPRDLAHVRAVDGALAAANRPMACPCEGRIGIHRPLAGGLPTHAGFGATFGRSTRPGTVNPASAEKADGERTIRCPAAAAKRPIAATHRTSVHHLTAAKRLILSSAGRQSQTLSVR